MCWREPDAEQTGALTRRQVLNTMSFMSLDRAACRVPYFVRIFAVLAGF